MKQYQKLFEFEGVELRFTEGALGAVAQQGAAPQVRRSRAPRDPRARRCSTLMYELPSRSDVAECVIGVEVIEQGAEPVLGLKREAESA